MHSMRWIVSHRKVICMAQIRAAKRSGSAFKQRRVRYSCDQAASDGEIGHLSPKELRLPSKRKVGPGFQESKSKPTHFTLHGSRDRQTPIVEESKSASERKRQNSIC